MFFFKQQTSYEMRISDWSSDVCSSDLRGRRHPAVVVARAAFGIARLVNREQHFGDELAAFVEHRIDHIGGGVGEPRQIGVAAQPDDVIEDEARAAHRRGIIGNCSYFIVSFAPVSVRARPPNLSVLCSPRTY